MKKIEVEILKWFTDNYIQDNNECIKILTQAQIDYYPFTIDDFMKGCIELRKIPLEGQDHLLTHIKLIGELSNVGVDANVAEEKLREILKYLNQKQ